jgi:ankyrin repeat protein
MQRRSQPRGNSRWPTPPNALTPHGLLALLTALLVPAPSAGFQVQASDLERSANLAVMIESEFDDATGIYFGAGLIVGRQNDSVYVVTANHLLRRGEQIATSVRVAFRMDPSRSFPATVLPLTEPGLDVAVLSLDGFDRLSVPFCSLPFRRLAATAPSAGETFVYALGYPNREAWGMPAIPDPVTRIAGSRIAFESRYVSVGHSGGPLLDEQGDLIGMIVGQSPSEGEALEIGPVLRRLERWNVPVFLDVRTSREPGSLHLAVRDSQLDDVRALLARCADLATVDSVGRTPLLYAVRTRNGEVIQALLDHGASIGADSVVNMRTQSGITPLHSAATFEDETLVRRLLEHGATIDARYPTMPDSARFDDGWTPLHVAAQHGNVATARALIAAGANVTLESARGESAVDRAIRGIGSDSTRTRDRDDESRAEVLAALYAAGSTGGIDLLATAIDRDAAAVVETILRHPDAAGSLSRRDAVSVTARAIRAGRASVVAALLANGIVDANEPVEQGCLTSDTDLLTLAACGESIDVARVLIEAGASVGGRSSRDPRYANTPIHAAVGRANVEMLRYLIEQGADPNVTPSLLVSAVARETRDDDHDVIRVGEVNVVRTLIELGALPDGPLPTQLGATRGPSPLQLAVVELIDQVQYLRAWEPPPEGPVASLSSIIDALLDEGADPDYFDPDYDGYSNPEPLPALHELVSAYLSAVRAYAPMTLETLRNAVAQLLEAGADPSIVVIGDDERETPLDRLSDRLSELPENEPERAAALRDLIDLFRAHGGR